jgi:Sulfotransferase domain
MGIRQTTANVLKELPLGVHKAVPPGLRRDLRHRLGRYYRYEAEFNFSNTPPLRPGETDGPPGFVGIGVQKAGTTWWYRLIVDHPGAADVIPESKELHFFARFGFQSFGPSDIADYKRQFPRRNDALTGEWTPDYLYYPWVPPLLAKAAPETKLLLILRDPIERFRSGLASEIRNGAAHVGATIAEVVGYTMYAENLRRWMDYFPPEQLLVLQYEHCKAAPVEQLVATYRFLGLDPEYRPSILNRPINKTLEEKPALDADVKSRLRDLFAPDVAELVKLVPTLDLSVWKGMNES